MAITQFEQNTINKAAEQHNAEQEQLIKELDRVKGEVDGLLSSSPSKSAKALQQVYELWYTEVKNVIVGGTHALTDAMVRTAASQQDADEQSASGTSSIAHFLTNA